LLTKKIKFADQIWGSQKKLRWGYEL
jgi:hypothetical protein